MHKSTTTNTQPEQVLNNEPNANNQHVSQPISKPNVSGCRVRPILFSSEMVRAILDGRKSQTRRVLKYAKAYNVFHDGKHEVEAEETKENMLPCKYRIGDILWVRETWQWDGDTSFYDIAPIGTFRYKADNDGYSPAKWKPSIFMPRDAARIFLKVTNIRVERLQVISTTDAKKEGVNIVDYVNQKISGLPLYNNYQFNVKQNWGDGDLSKTYAFSDPRNSFRTLWQKINGQESWSENHFVWVIEFERCERPVGSR